MKEKIAAVVVTYNRLKLLQRSIENLRNQTHKIDFIMIINNGSTDGTKEWLDTQTDLIIIHQENVGGSGGFYRGIKEAYGLGVDWIWCMDDDVFARYDCLENLLAVKNPQRGILCPRRYQDGNLFISEFKTLNVSNPFKRLHLTELKESDIVDSQPINIMGMVFEGPLIKREVVSKIGLPNKELFLLYDDTDYSFRATLAGYDVVYVPNAILDKELFFQNQTKVQMLRNKRWRLWYHIRNTSYFCHHYGTNIWFRNLGEWQLILEMFLAICFNLIRKTGKYDKEDIVKLFKMRCIGHKEQLGKM